MLFIIICNNVIKYNRENFSNSKKGQCVLDGDNEACDVELTCNPDTMDIQFGHNLFGSGYFHLKIIF